MKKERSGVSPWKRLEKAEMGPVTNLACILTVFLTQQYFSPLFPYNDQNSNRGEGRQSRVMTFLEDQSSRGQLCHAATFTLDQHQILQLLILLFEQCIFTLALSSMLKKKATEAM